MHAQNSLCRRCDMKTNNDIEAEAVSANKDKKSLLSIRADGDRRLCHLTHRAP